MIYNTTSININEQKGWAKMSIKKELLNELTKQQLKEFAMYKGINLELNNTKRKYYENWNEKDMLVDLMADIKDLTLAEIEKFIVTQKS